MTEVARLLMAVKAGERTAFEGLVRSQVDRLYTIARRITGDRIAAEDVVQETFLRILQGRASLRKAEAAEAWLARIAACIAVDIVRGREARRRTEEGHAMVGKSSSTPEEALLDAEEAEAVTQAFAGLPLETRAALWLHVVEGIGIREVADALGGSRGSAHRRIRGGIEALRRQLLGRGFSRAARAPLAAVLVGLPQLLAPPSLLARVEALAGTLPAALGAAAGSAAVSPALSSSPAPVAAAGIGGLIMSGKKVAISLALSLVLFVGGAILIVKQFDSQKATDLALTGGPAAPRPTQGTDGDAAPNRARAQVAAGAPAPESGEAIDGRPLSIHGKITDASGRGLPGAEILAVDVQAWNELFGGAPRETVATLAAASERLRELRSRFARVRETLPRARSGDGGSYALRGLDDGEYRLVVKRAGHLPDGDSFALVAAGRPARCDVELGAAWAISGRVVDGDQRPVEGAAIRARPSTSRAREGVQRTLVFRELAELLDGNVLLEDALAPSSRDGAFELDSLEPVPHDLEALKDGYLAGEALDLQPGAGGVVIVMRRGGEVEGRILDARGSPVAGASVSLRRVPPPATGGATEPAGFLPRDGLEDGAQSAAAGDDGRFRLGALEEGEHELRVGVDGVLRHRSEVAVSGSLTALGDIVLAAGARLEGVVLGPDSEPVAGARVWVPEPPRVGPEPSADLWAIQEALDWQTRFAEPLAEAVSGPDGRFALAGLGAGDVDVLAAAEGRTGSMVRGVPAGRRDLTITLGPGLAFQGKVLDAARDLGIEGAAVALEIPGNPTAVTGPAGSFEFQGVTVPPGTVLLRVRAAHPDYGDGLTSLSPERARAQESFEIRLLPRRRLAGIVRDSNGAPVANARVGVEVQGLPEVARLLLLGNPGPVASSAGDGSFTADLPDKIGDTPVSAVEVASHPSFATSRVGPIPLGGQGTDLPLEIVLSEGSVLEGKVLDARGSPVAGARVAAIRAIPAGEEAMRFSVDLPRTRGKGAYSGKDGEYRIRRLEPALHDLEVEAPGLPRRKLAGIQVGPGTTRQDILIDAGRTIGARVVDGSRTPLEGVEVVAFLDEEEDAADSGGRSRGYRRFQRLSSGEGVASTRSGADGRFEITNVPDGVFHVVARLKGHEPADVVPVRPGDPLPDLVLIQLGAIGGTVTTRDTGRPLTRYRVQLFKRKVEGDRHRIGYESETDAGFYLAPLDSADPEGRFLHQGLLPGSYKVSVKAEGYAPYHGETPLGAGEERSLEVVLDRGYWIEGVVLDAATGNPIAGATIDHPTKGALRAGARSIRSGKDGSFRIEGLEEGKHFLIAWHDEYYYDQSLKKCVVARMPQDSGSRVELRMEPAGRFKGTIRNLKLNPEGGASFFLALVALEGGHEGRTAGADDSADGERPFEQWVWLQDRDGGRCEGRSLRPGKFRVELRRPRNEKLADLGEVEIRAAETRTFEAEAP